MNIFKRKIMNETKVDVVCPICSTSMVPVSKISSALLGICFYLCMGFLIILLVIKGYADAGFGDLQAVICIGVFVYIMRSMISTQEMAWVCPRCGFGFFQHPHFIRIKYRKNPGQ